MSGRDLFACPGGTAAADIPEFLSPGLHITQIPSVMTGERDKSDQLLATTDLKLREGWSNRP